MYNPSVYRRADLVFFLLVNASGSILKNFRDTINRISVALLQRQLCDCFDEKMKNERIREQYIPWGLT